MNLFKKATATVALVTLVSGIFSTGAYASSSSEIEAANALAEAGIITDHSDDTSAYSLDQNVLRQEIAAVARGVAGLDKKDTCDNVFSDVSATTPNTWACYSVEALADAELIATNDTFRPEDNISKAEAVGMMVKAAFGDDYSYDADLGTTWQEQVVDFAVDNGVVASFTNYDSSATRGFVFEAGANSISSTEEDDSDNILFDLLGGLDDLDSDEMDDVDTTEVVVDADEEDDTTTSVVVSGDNELTVELSPESPTDGYVAAGRDRTEILAFEVTAGSEDVTLDEALIEYIGLSDSDDFDVLSIYLESEKVTKGDSKGFSDGEVELAFENDTVIMAGETKTLFVTANVAESDGTSYHKIALTELSASSDVEGDYVKSVSFTVVDSTNVGSIELDIDEEGGNIVIGDVETLASFSLEETDDIEDIELRSITIEFDGFDAEDDLSDVVLYADGEEIASDIEINSDDEIVLDLDFTIEADEKVEFELEWVVTGSIGDSVTAYITDIYAVGEETGMVADVEGDEYTVELSDDRTIEGSEINVSFDKSDIDEAMPSAEEVLVGTLELSSVSDYTIDEIQVFVQSDSANGTGTIDAVDDLELDGSSYDDYEQTSTGVYYTFEDIDLSADEDLELDLTFDVVDETSLNGTDLTFEVTLVKVTDEENDETYTDGGTYDLDTILSTNSLDDKTIDIESASLTITQTTMTDDELVIGNGVEVILYKGKISVGDSDSITLDDLVFTGSLTDSGSNAVSYDFEDIIDSVELNIDGETFDGDVESDSIEFTSMNAEIEAGEDNLVVTVTATLTDSDDVQDGDIMILDNIDTAELSVEDSEGEDLLDANIDINDSSNDTTLVLNDSGTLDFNIVNGGENEDEIEAVVLAGTSSVALAEIELEANDEDMKIKELSFIVSGDLSTTVEDVRILNGSSIIADGAVVTYDSGDDETTITFEDDFTIEDSSDEIEALLVADLYTYTTEGGEVSASLESIAIDVDAIEVKGVNSNDDITVDLSESETSDAVTVVPALVTVSIDDELGNSDSDAEISFSVDKGDNEMDNDDVVIYSIELSTAISGSGVTVRNDDDEDLITDFSGTGLLVYSNYAASATGATNDDDAVDDATINDGDEFEFSLDAEEEIRIVKYGVTYWIDLDDEGDIDSDELFTITNDSVLDLGEYDAD